MNVDYIALRPEMTVADAILKIRQVGLNKRDDLHLLCHRKSKLVGVVDMKELLTTREPK